MSFLRGFQDPTATSDSIGYANGGYFYTTAAVDPYASTWYLGQLFRDSRVQQAATAAMHGVLRLMPNR